MMKLLVVCAALAGLVASPAFAQSHSREVHPSGVLQSPYGAYNAVTPFGSPSLDLKRADHVDAARAAAIRACSAQALPYKEYTWGDMEFQQYRACMAQHGEVE
jgi:hypothetical protein